MKKSNTYLLLVTFVAAMGGLLFGHFHRFGSRLDVIILLYQNIASSEESLQNSSYLN
jgi:hypothetical protein